MLWSLPVIFRRQGILMGGLAGLLLLSATATWAEPLRVALVGTPENVEEATNTALLPWRIEVIHLPDNPGLRDWSSTQRARELARAYNVRAVVWLARPSTPEPIATSSDELAGLPSAPILPTLWLYDARTEAITTRPIPSQPPFDDPVAASVALSIKTLLRNSRLIPDENEPGGTEKGPGGTRQGPEAPPTEQPPPPPPPVPPARQSSQAFGMEANLALHVGLGSLAPSPEPRLWLGFVWSPSFLFPAYMVAVEASVGPSTSIDRDPFHGDLTDLAAGLRVRRAFPLTARFALTAALAGSLHFTRLDGTVTTIGRETHTSRTNPHLGVQLAAESHLPSGLSLFACVDAVWSLDRQRYLVDDEPVLTLPRLATEVGVGARFLFDW